MSSTMQGNEIPIVKVITVDGKYIMDMDIIESLKKLYSDGEHIGIIRGQEVVIFDTEIIIPINKDGTLQDKPPIFKITIKVNRNFADLEV